MPREEPIPLKVSAGSVTWYIPSSGWSVRALTDGANYIFHPDTGGRWYWYGDALPLGDSRDHRLRRARAWMMFTWSHRVSRRPWLFQRLINFSNSQPGS